MLRLVIRIHIPNTKQCNTKMHIDIFSYFFFFSSNSRDAYLIYCILTDEKLYKLLQLKVSLIYFFFFFCGSSLIVQNLNPVTYLRTKLLANALKEPTPRHV